MRAASGLAVAVGLGLALGLVLTSSAGIGGGQYWIIVVIWACLFVGWLAAQLTPVGSLVTGPALVLVMTAVLFAVKLVRLPDAPLTGDGVELLVAIYAAFGALGALIGRRGSARRPLPSLASAYGLPWRPLR